MTTDRIFPSGHTIYCDDIRYEVNDKITFIGTYPGRMVIFAEPPVNIVQLCAFVMMWMEPNEIPDELTARLNFVGDSGEERTLWERVVAPTKPNPQDAPLVAKDALPHVEWRIAAQLPGLHFIESGYVKSRVYYGKREVRLGVLRVDFQPTSDFSEQEEKIKR